MKKPEFVSKLRFRKEYFQIPKSVQESIPIQKIYKDGIFYTQGRYSKTWRFYDINYEVASEEEKGNMLLDYASLLNTLPIHAQVKITLFNRKLNPKEFSQNLLMQLQGDGLDHFRAEYNNMLFERTQSSNNLMQEKYITISVEQKTIEEARAFFQQVGVDLTSGFSRLDSGVREITIQDRLRLFHDFYRSGEEAYFRFDFEEMQTFGNDFKNQIAPECLSVKKDYFELGDQVGRVLFVRDYGSFVSDTILTELMNLPQNMMLSIDLYPLSTEEALKMASKHLLSVDTEINRWQQNQNTNLNFSAAIPFQLQQERENGRELMDDVMNRDQRLMFSMVTLTHLADTLEQLDSDTKALISAGRGRACELAVLKYQQEDGLNTVLPYGIRKIDAMHLLTTQSVTAFMPFKSQEIQDNGGIYYGVNAVSHNLLICNRHNLLNGNGFILGVSGSGKSFAAKQEIASVALSTKDDIIIVDPEREYGPLVTALKGEMVLISASSKDASFINALDLTEGYGDGKNPLVLKSEFILSLCEQLMGSERIGPSEKSIIDRCLINIYEKYLKTYQGEPPTLLDLYDDLLKQADPKAQNIALALELFTKGSLNLFAHQTTVNTNNRILCFDIQDLGENLKPIGLLVMLDAILNRVIQNRKKGVYTHVYIDEIYLFFSNNNSITNYSGEFLRKCWKRFRKYYAQLTGITQNVEECLLSDTARQMFANSEFLLMFNQAPTDQVELARLLNISSTQMGYIRNAPAGRGLMKIGAGMVPFINEFPTDTALYKLMTTKPGEMEL